MYQNAGKCYDQHIFKDIIKYTSAEAAREEAGFEPMKTYIPKRKNTVAQNIAMWPILDLWKAAERKRGDRVGMWWWEQAVIELAGSRETEAAESEAEEDGLAE